MATVKTQGCSIKYVDTTVSPVTKTAIASVTGYQGPTGSRQVIDGTTLADIAKVKDVGLPDFGQISADWNYADAGSDTQWLAVYDAFVAGTLETFQLEFSDSPATQFDFTGYVLNASFSVGADDIVRGSFTIEISGSVTDNLA